MKKNRLKYLLLISTIFLPFSQILSVEGKTYDPNIETSSKSILMTNLDTKEVVYKKEEDAKREPASCTKIMTYIIAVESISDLKNTIITVGPEVEGQLKDTDSSTAGLKTGEKLSALELLNCMMIPSGNDAALTLADFIGGGDSKKFVDLMNAKAEALGCKNTHFANPDGLHDDNHYTTASDLTKITEEALSKKYFRDITNQTSYTIPPTNIVPVPREIYTTNFMLLPEDSTYYSKYVKGIKTGSHDQAGYCLVSEGIGDTKYLTVALDAPYRDENGKHIYSRGEMIDSKNLYNWAFTALTLGKIVSSKDSVGESDLKYVWGHNKITYVPQKDYESILPKGYSKSDITTKVEVPNVIEAPVVKGNVYGSERIFYKGEELGKVNLIANESYGKNYFLVVVSSIWFYVSLIALALLGILIKVKAKKRRSEKLDLGKKKSRKHN